MSLVNSCDRFTSHATINEKDQYRKNEIRKARVRSNGSRVKLSFSAWKFGKFSMAMGWEICGSVAGHVSLKLRQFRRPLWHLGYASRAMNMARTSNFTRVTPHCRDWYYSGLRSFRRSFPMRGFNIAMVFYSECRGWYRKFLLRSSMDEKKHDTVDEYAWLSQ